MDCPGPTPFLRRAVAEPPTTSVWSKPDFPTVCELGASAHIREMKLFGHKKGHQSAFDADRYRAAAEKLRDTNPEVFSQILRETDGSPAGPVAMGDPVTFVAWYLEMREELGVGG
jgi:hypothetical protein